MVHSRSAPSEQGMLFILVSELLVIMLLAQSTIRSLPVKDNTIALIKRTSANWAVGPLDFAGVAYWRVQGPRK